MTAIRIRFLSRNGFRLLKWPLDEVMDTAVRGDFEKTVRRIAEGSKGVLYVEKCWIRKSGTRYLVDLHVTVEKTLTVEEGHRIAQRVKRDLIQSGLLIGDAMIHIEPSGMS